MKKSLLIGSLLFTAGGWGMTPAPLVAQHPQVIVADQHQEQVSKSSVTVLDYGAAERQQLRFTPTVGESQQVTVRMAMDMAITFNGQAIPAISAPAVEMAMDWRVDQIDADGKIHTTFKYTDITLETDDTTPSGLADAVQTQLDPLKGTEGKVIFDNRGQVQDFQYDVPEAFADNQTQIVDQLSNSVQQLSNPLPEEAVGIGATWRVPQTVSLSGITLTQTATYKLLGYQDNVMQVEVTIQQDGKTGAEGIAGLPPGAQATLESLTSTGTGQLRQDLGQITPAQMNLELAIQMVMKVISGDNEAIFDADMNMKLSQTATP